MIFAKELSCFWSRKTRTFLSLGYYQLFLVVFFKAVLACGSAVVYEEKVTETTGRASL